jgi:hypothetical protein
VVGTLIEAANDVPLNFEMAFHRRQGTLKAKNVAREGAWQIKQANILT